MTEYLDAARVSINLYRSKCDQKFEKLPKIFTKKEMFFEIAQISTNLI